MLARPENTDRELLPTRILLAITGNAQGMLSYTVQKHHLERTAHQDLVCLEEYNCRFARRWSLIPGFG